MFNPTKLVMGEAIYKENNRKIIGNLITHYSKPHSKTHRYYSHLGGMILNVELGLKMLT